MDFSFRKFIEKYRNINVLDESFGLVSFTPDGTILDANERFLGLAGYSLSDLAGRHHRILVAPAERDSAAYAEFWRGLAAGTSRSGVFRRIGK
ncbi:MAG: hypothetical protein B7Z70_12295, partial [Acidithiobacillus ferrivorans]